jgi:cyclohexanone monooxygenase
MTNSLDQRFDVLIIGAGFSGIYQLYRLRELGFNVHLFEAGSGLGGIWHWNCYPGARTDTHCQIYQYSIDELWKEWKWSELFPSWKEMQDYFSFVDHKLSLSKDISFNSRIASAEFDQGKREWIVHPEGKAPVRAQLVIANTGFGSKPHIPKVEGIESFKGECHHTALWPQSGLDLTGKRVAVIGTGASGVQVAQEAAHCAKHLTVFQRTPNLALPMQQQTLSEEDNRKMREELPALFEARGGSFAGFGFDFIPKNATEVSDKERNDTYESLWNSGGFRYWLANFQDTVFVDESNQYAYEFWRNKVRARIKDPALAEMLAPTKAPHPFGTKRPSLEQWYYEIFNQGNVKLVDLNESPILRMKEHSIVTKDGEIEVDVIVFATGFDAVTGGLTSMDIRSTEGKNFKQVWADGVRTHLGIATAGFPNMLFGYGPQSPCGFCNGPSSAEYQGDMLVEMIKYMRDKKITRFEALPEAQEAWRKLIADFWAMTLFPKAKSWYTGVNIPGKVVESLNFPLGLPAYLSKFRESASNGYSGFTLS